MRESSRLYQFVSAIFRDLNDTRAYGETQGDRRDEDASAVAVSHGAYNGIMKVS